MTLTLWKSNISRPVTWPNIYALASSLDQSLLRQKIILCDICKKMIPVPDKKNIPMGKMDLVFSIVLKIHLQFQQGLPKRYINSHGVCVTFLQKESVCVMKIVILELK